MYQHNTLYTLNLHNVTCQIHSIKVKKLKIIFILFNPIRLKGVKNLQEFELMSWPCKICVNIINGFSFGRTRVADECFSMFRFF